VSPAGRRERESAIRQILADKPIHTQAELVSELLECGFTVTQATVSRDIRRLGVVKLPAVGGAPRYLPRDEAIAVPNGNGQTASENMAAAFRESVLQVDSGDALLAVRTPPGLANAVAITIDRARIPEIVATLAGDDTIFVLSRSVADRRRVRRLLEGYL
jgi:transcriptional regulator of arginine metabolism